MFHIFFTVKGDGYLLGFAAEVCQYDDVAVGSFQQIGFHIVDIAADPGFDRQAQGFDVVPVVCRIFPNQRGAVAVSDCHAAAAVIAAGKSGDFFAGGGAVIADTGEKSHIDHFASAQSKGAVHRLLEAHIGRQCAVDFYDRTFFAQHLVSAASGSFFQDKLLPRDHRGKGGVELITGHGIGGEQQRTAIARSLINDPVLLLADEPTGNLDPKTGETILELFKSLRQENPALTILMITHNMDEAALADRIIVLQRGEIVSDGTPKEVFAENVPRFGLALPPATETAYKLKEKGFIFDEVIINEDELVEGICKQLR